MIFKPSYQGNQSAIKLQAPAIILRRQLKNIFSVEEALTQTLFREPSMIFTTTAFGSSRESALAAA
jgi:hypothetical protein